MQIANPAAQYLRMSTEHQQYSMENQSAAIQRYAEKQGFTIVRTYSDAAKRGIVLKNRAGLRQLLQDVISARQTYGVVLVYDVSRWGRFQDTDEAAHYEFLCKSAGVPVHYCAESFGNDGSLPNLIMKTLKRTMAGEFSRELSVKVLEGHKRLAQLGFKQGGLPGYGLRRMLVSPDRQPQQQLVRGQRKSIATDRVILVPGPAHEVQCVREIYRLLIEEKRTAYWIAGEFNRQGVPYVDGGEWDYQAVYMILTHPKYMGCHVYGRTSQRLCTPVVRKPRSEWTITPGAYEPLVDQVTFAEAQRILLGRTINKSDEELLKTLKALHERKGRLSLELIQNSPGAPSPSTYRRRFGSLRRAYELIGHGAPDDFGPIDLRCRTRALRQQLIERLRGAFPDELTIVRKGARWRARLRLRNGSHVAVFVCRSVRTWKTVIRWIVDPVKRERNLLTLLARLDTENRSFQDFYVLPSMDRRKRFTITLKDEWLKRGKRLPSLSRFCETAKIIHRVRFK